MSVPGRSREESLIASTVESILLEAGVSSDWIVRDDAHQRSPGQTGNLIVRLPGTRSARRRLFMAHLDTVPICVGSQPVRSGDWITSSNPETGLGGDDRAGVAVIVNTVRTLLEQRLDHGPLTLFFPVQEEIGLCGARHVSVDALGQPAACFNWDGSEPEELCIGATGDYAIEIEITGLPSHAGVHPEEGVSAAAVASLAIADLVSHGWHGLIVKPEGRGTSNVGEIHGGEATNVVMPKLRLRAEARSHDPVFRKAIVAAYETAFRSACERVVTAGGRHGSVHFHAELKYESFRMPEDHPTVDLAARAVRSIGLEPSTRIGNGGLDANWMTAHGLPTVTLGCGQDLIHTADERLHVPSYLNACRIALALATLPDSELPHATR